MKGLNIPFYSKAVLFGLKVTFLHYKLFSNKKRPERKREMDIDFPLNRKVSSIFILDIYSVKTLHCNPTQQQTFLSANSTSLHANNLYIFIYTQTQAAAPPSGKAGPQAVRLKETRSPDGYFLRPFKLMGRWFLNIQAALGKRKIIIKFLLASLTTVTYLKHTYTTESSSSRIRISVPAFLCCHWSIFSSVCTCHSWLLDFENHRWLLGQLLKSQAATESQNKLPDKGYWKDF